ncbi:hypothetical protein [Sphingomonas koreensis]
MRRKAQSDPAQLPLQFDSQDELEQLIEARVAELCEAESYRWRFRLVLIETALFSALVAGAGFTLGQPTTTVLRATVLIGASCFVTGAMLVGLSAFSSRLWSRLQRRRAS